MKNHKSRINKLVLTAMMMCMVVVMTMIIRIPVPATQGYIHLGDCMIFFSVLLLGYKWGAAAAGIGSAMADLLAGYAIYAPVTLIVKSLMALIMGLALEYAFKRGFGNKAMKFAEIVSMVISGLIMVSGYYIAESFMYGSFVTPLASIPMNILQFVTGIVLATVLSAALYRTPARNKFTYVITSPARS